ncbi:MAG: prolyl oligopeptidase family serine peptidase [Steroidobacteraceae bacterium]
MNKSRLLRSLCFVLFTGMMAADAHCAAPGRTEVGTLIYDGITPATPERLPDYLEARSAGLVDWLADGSLVIATRFGNAEQLHRVRAPLGMREQLTFLPEPVRAGAANPYDAEQLLELRDQGGNENMQLYLQNLATGKARLLTDGRSLHGTPVWAHDGKRIAFHGNGRDGASYDIYVVDASNANAAPQLVIGGGSDALYVQDWSLDDSKLLLLRYRSITDSELLIADIATGSLQPVEPAAGVKGPVSVLQGRFSRDGRGVFFLSDHGGEFTELRYTDMFTGETQVLAPQTRSDAELFDLSRDGRYLAYTLNEAGYSRLVLHDLAQNADLLLPALPPGAVISALAFDRAGKRLALNIESGTAPRDVYVLELAAADGKPQLLRWTQSEVGPLDRATFAAPELTEFPTWDRIGTQQRMLPAFVYRPRTPGPHPVIIDIHGGPEAQYRPTWSAFTQFLVNELGYAVVAPNVRGSSGYGRSFLELDNGMLREDAVRDIGSLLVWIGLQKDFDRGRVAVMGGSYGGYMALASLVNYGDRLAGGVDIVGISNFVSFLTNTSPYRRDLRRAEYGDERVPAMRAFLQRISPLSNAAALRRPLLVVQGLNDPRVPASESEQLVQQLRLNGVEVGYLAAKDEGHGFRKKGNRDAYLAAVAQFLQSLK